MVKYCREIARPDKTAKAQANDVRVHFKNTFEVVKAIRNKTLKAATSHLHAVLKHKRAIPFTRYHRGIGRHAQGKEFGNVLARWPVKSVRAVLKVLGSATNNATASGLAADKLFVSHAAVQPAMKRRRRTYRAHGRINPYMSSPSHIQVYLEESIKNVPGAAVAAEGKKVKRKGLSNGATSVVSA